MKLKEMVNKQFGNWLVIERSYASAYDNKQAMWICECQCANKTRKVLGGTSLRLGQTKGCRVCKSSYNKLRPYESLYRRMKRDNTGALRTIDFSLTYEDFLHFTDEKKCYYCHAPILWKKFTSTGHGYNLDRADNTKGYSKYNLVVCCKRCNMGKRDTFSFEEWYGMTAYFRKELYA